MNGAVKPIAGVSSSKRKASSPSSRRRNDKTSKGNEQAEGTISPDEIVAEPLQQVKPPPPSTDFSVRQPHISPGQNSMAPSGTPNIPTLSSIPFSPPYNFSNVTLANQQESFDPMLGMPQMGLSTSQTMQGFSFDQSQQAMTPGGKSTGDSTGSREEKDPFLSLLEQLAENEHSRGGPSELDFFLSGQGQ
jgi:hypothetical protein